MLKSALLVALVLFSSVAAAAQPQPAAPAADPFAYDNRLPLDFREAGVEQLSGATWGGALAGVEKRARVYVLMGGLPACR